MGRPMHRTRRSRPMTLPELRFSSAHALSRRTTRPPSAADRGVLVRCRRAAATAAAFAGGVAGAASAVGHPGLAEGTGRPAPGGLLAVRIPDRLRPPGPPALGGPA